MMTNAMGGFHWISIGFPQLGSSAKENKIHRRIGKIDNPKRKKIIGRERIPLVWQW